MYSITGESIPLTTRPTEILEPEERPARILVADDNPHNRMLLAARLRRQKYEVETVIDGQAALDLLALEPFDLVLLDIMMPRLNGFRTLEAIKADERLRELPVIMISALDDLESVVRCLKLGAEDHLPKPFNSVLLQARISASLEKKRLRDRERAYLAEIEAERAHSERLLLNILPRSIVERLKASPEWIADSFESVTVLFADIADFTAFAAKIPAAEVVRLLGHLFSAFDHHVESLGLEKIKTIGDAYMAVGGVPEPVELHAVQVARLALAMQEEMVRFNHKFGCDLALRIGINSGPVIAGVIGSSKFSYDLWGDSVNIASRMEKSGLPGRIQLAAQTRTLLGDRFEIEPRGTTQVRGRGKMEVFFLGVERGNDPAPHPASTSGPAAPPLSR